MMKRLHWPVSLAVLTLVIVIFDPTRLAEEIRSFHPMWVALALLVTVVQTLLSAWRWRFTAARLDLPLSWRRAISDYYLACFANQTLPGGVLGDAWRAQRHAEQVGQPGTAWRAVLIERGSGQVLVVCFSIVSLLALMQWGEWIGSERSPRSIGLLFDLLTVSSAGAGIILFLAWLTRHRWHRHWITFSADVRRGLLAARAWPLQLLGSLLIVLSYALVFVLAAKAIEVDLPLPLLLGVALPVLLAMLIPLSVAGWGWREVAAAGLWMSLGMPPEQGIAVSMAYGAIVALSTAPGLVIWLIRPAEAVREGDRTANQRPERMSTSTRSS